MATRSKERNTPVRMLTSMACNISTDPDHNDCVIVQPGRIAWLTPDDARRMSERRLVEQVTVDEAEATEAALKDGLIEHDNAGYRLTPRGVLALQGDNKKARKIVERGIVTSVATAQ